jgi:hypothetical protein
MEQLAPRIQESHWQRDRAQIEPQNQTAASTKRGGLNVIPLQRFMERATGLEPATSSLGSWHSTN